MAKHILLIALLATASGCGWLFGSDDDHHDHHDTDAGADAGPSANIGNVGEPDMGTPNNALEPDVGVEPPLTFYSEPREDRCADTSFERCGNVTLEELTPATASRLDYMMLADVDVDCTDSIEEITAAHDGLGCVFVQLAQYIDGPLEPYHIQTPFVYELYADGDVSRLGIYEVDENETVVDAPYRYLTRSLWGLDEVIVDGGVSATDGTVPLRTDYWGFPLSVTIRDASLTATEALAADGTTILGEGEVRGHIEVLDLYESLNAQASVCAGEQVAPFTDELSQSEPCADYSEHEARACQRYTTYCPLFQVFAATADVDLNADGVGDAFSVRFDVEFVEGDRVF